MNDYILEMKGITKTFPGVRALNDVSFRVKRGTVHALVGENGAGKSTLMKVLNGVFPANEGQIFVNGEEVYFKNTGEAQERGLGFVFQECNLVNTLSAAENIYLNRFEKNRFGKILWKNMNEKAQALIDRLGFNFNVKRRVAELSAAEKQLVEIAKVLSIDAKLIVMDEPTSSLTNNEVEKLFEIVRQLKSEGITIIYISHKLDEVFNLCDTITVLRDGEIIDTKPTEEMTHERVIELMVGRSVDMEFPKRNVQRGEVVLQAKDICSHGYLKNISFDLRRGEVLGIAGLVGSGRTELAEAIFGAAKRESGEITIKGKAVDIRSTTNGKDNSIGMVPEDRKEVGLVLDYDVAQNITITNLPKICRKSVLNKKSEKEFAKEYIGELNIKTPSIEQLVVNLSGGNQQKVVLAKWLFSDADILILDEPTRGIDVGAKYEIYLLINKLVEQGKSVIVISSELPEVIGMSDRVMVLASGMKKGELEGGEISAEAVMKLATS